MTSELTYSQRADLAQRIARDPQQLEAYLLGQQDGYSQGYADAEVTAETHAERAARLFYTMEAGEEWQRQAAKSAHEAINIVAEREKTRKGVYAR